VSAPRLPEPARSIAAAVTGAVGAAGAHDVEAFEPAVAALAGLNGQQVGAVLGTVTRLLLEDLHPDGLDGDDVRAALERCVRGSGWTAGVDPEVLVVLLTDALGVHQPDEHRRPLTAPDLARNGSLLVADLLAVAGRPVGGYLTAAFGEIAHREAG
jgi:hypothetical protein